MKEKEKFVKLCPRCGSMNISSQGLISIFIPLAYRCKSCKYRGNVIEVEESKVKRFIDDVRRRAR